MTIHSENNEHLDCVHNKIIHRFLFSQNYNKS